MEKYEKAKLKDDSNPNKSPPKQKPKLKTGDDDEILNV